MTLRDDFDDRFAEAGGRRDRFEKLTRLRAAQRQDCTELRKQVDTLARQLRAEEADVEQLEHSTLKSVLLGLLGNRDAALDKERQEAEMARFKHAQAARRLAQLEADQANTEREVATLPGAVEAYERLVAEKERRIRQAGGSAASQLLAAAETEVRLKTHLRELDEAIQAGEAAESALQSVERSLGSAQSWGTWDTLGGGLIATAIKHSRLDDAQNAAQSAQHALDRFARELKDVQVNLQIQGPDVGELTILRDRVPRRSAAYGSRSCTRRFAPMSRAGRVNGRTVRGHVRPRIVSGAAKAPHLCRPIRGVVGARAGRVPGCAGARSGSGHLTVAGSAGLAG